MNPYSKLKQAVRDGDNTTALFVLAWMEGSLGTEDQIHGNGHMDTVQRALGDAFHFLETHPGALE